MSAVAGRPVEGLVARRRKAEREGKKKARKEARRVGRAQGGEGEGGMEVDAGEVFMVG